MHRSNNSKAGVEAGSLGVNGYRSTHVAGKRQYTHRIAWAMHHGEWPPDQIDHINGVKDDNRICNLRLASSRQNVCNSNRPISKTSGARGVTWDKARRGWTAQIKRNYKNYYLGTFSTIPEAAEAYRKGAEDLHGEFSILRRPTSNLN